MSSIVCSKSTRTFPKLSISIPPFNVLLLEEKPEDAFVLTRTLNNVGKVFWEQGLKNGINLASLNKFDVVLIDLNLVSKYSLEAFDKFHKQCPDLPIILLSDSDAVLFAESAIEAGALGVINKKHLHDGDYLIKVVTNHLLKARFVKNAAKLYFSKKRNHLSLIKR